jgi:hypothetical protein
VRITFGKYQGHRVQDIPSDYLQWVLANCTNINPRLRGAIRQELERRTGRTGYHHREHQHEYGGYHRHHRQHDHHHQPGGASDPPPPDKLAGIIRTWFRELTLKWHPDRGGCKEAMQAINDAHERLVELLKSV